MDALCNLVVACAAVVGLSSCGDDGTTQEVGDPASTSASASVSSPAPASDSSSPSSTESSSESQSTSDITEPATSTTELFATIDAAVAKEASVRQEMGSRNSPASTVVDQEYGEDRGNLVFRADLGPQTDPFLVYRVDGLLYARGQEPKPMSEIDPNDSALLAVTLYSDVRQDFQRMAVLADNFSYVGGEDLGGVSTHHYRVTLTLAPGANPATVPSLAKGPRPADLWIGANGLPVRVDVKYSEPLGGIPGTGVSRTDYSAWSVPLKLDPENLDWD